MRNKILQGDCLTKLKELPDKFIDMVITSPPYNQGLTTQDKTKNLYTDSLPEDEYIAFIKNIFLEIYRVLKDKGSFFYNFKSNVSENILSPAFKHLMTVNYERFKIAGEIIWNYAGNFDSTRTRFPVDYEMIYHLVKGKDFNFYDQKEKLTSVWDMRHVMFGTEEKAQTGDHPCPFPLHLVKKCMIWTTQKKDIVLDPFLGSGTTAVACKELERDYIGIEINPEYCKIAEKRLANTMGSLF